MLKKPLSFPLSGIFGVALVSSISTTHFQEKSCLHYAYLQSVLPSVDATMSFQLRYSFGVPDIAPHAQRGLPDMPRINVLEEQERRLKYI